MSKQRTRKEPVTFEFQGRECVLELGRYQHGGRLALSVLEKQTREPWTEATVNIPEAPLRPGEVFIKDYSENEGLLQALYDARIVMSTGEHVQSGYVRIPKCLLMVPVPEHFRDGTLLERTVTPERSRQAEREF